MELHPGLTMSQFSSASHKFMNHVCIVKSLCENDYVTLYLERKVISREIGTTFGLLIKCFGEQGLVYLNYQEITEITQVSVTDEIMFKLEYDL